MKNYHSDGISTDFRREIMHYHGKYHSGDESQCDIKTSEIFFKQKLQKKKKKICKIKRKPSKKYRGYNGDEKEEQSKEQNETHLIAEEILHELEDTIKNEREVESRILMLRFFILKESCCQLGVGSLFKELGMFAALNC